MSRGDMTAAMTLTRLAAVTRGQSEPPLALDWPWTQEEQVETVTHDEFTALEARLRASSAISQVRTPEAEPSPTE